MCLHVSAWCGGGQAELFNRETYEDERDMLAGAPTLSRDCSLAFVSKMTLLLEQSTDAKLPAFDMLHAVSVETGGKVWSTVRGIASAPPVLSADQVRGRGGKYFSSEAFS